MSMPAQLNFSTSNKSKLPNGLLIATILVILQIVVRASFLVSTLVMSARFLGNGTFLILVVLIPAVLLILTIVMVALIFARTPAAKPYGITVCILNLVSQVYGIGRLITIYATHPNISISPLAIAVSIAYLAVFTVALIFLIRWRVRDAAVPPPLPLSAATPETSHRGLALASLICAICGPLAMIILGPVALGLGIAARTKMSRSKNFDGAGMALAGIIIGSIETVLSVLIVLAAIAMEPNLFQTR
jgi:Domain of unknown function (DUF4190)